MNRSLTIHLDGAEAPFAPFARIHLTGKTGLALYPYLFTLEIWNLSDSQHLQLFRARQITVMRDNSCIAFGQLSDVYRRTVPEGTVTTAAISLGLDLWQARIAHTASAGDTLFNTVRSLLDASNTSIPLLDVSGEDPILPRGQSFCGRASLCIAEALSTAKARGVLTPAGLKVIRADPAPTDEAQPPATASPPLPLTTADLTDAPAFAAGGKNLILSTTVTGFQPGDEVTLTCNNTTCTGLILERMVDADTATGPWRTELLIGRKDDA